MSYSRPSNLLRFALIGDAVASGATGLLMALGAGLLTGLLGLPESLLRIAGLILLPTPPCSPIWARASGSHEEPFGA